MLKCYTFHGPVVVVVVVVVAELCNIRLNTELSQYSVLGSLVIVKVDSSNSIIDYSVVVVDLDI